MASVMEMSLDEEQHRMKLARRIYYIDLLM